MHPAKPSDKIVHIVICWLKHPGDAAERQQLVDASHSLQKVISGLRKVQVGPVMPGGKPPVDASFDVGIVMEFDSEMALANYEASPQHQQAVRDILLPLVDHYTVYNFSKTPK